MQCAIATSIYLLTSLHANNSDNAQKLLLSRLSVCPSND